MAYPSKEQKHIKEKISTLHNKIKCENFFSNFPHLIISAYSCGENSLKKIKNKNTCKTPTKKKMFYAYRHFM